MFKPTDMVKDKLTGITGICVAAIKDDQCLLKYPYGCNYLDNWYSLTDDRFELCTAQFTSDQDKPNSVAFAADLLHLSTLHYANDDADKISKSTYDTCVSFILKFAETDTRKTKLDCYVRLTMYLWIPNLAKDTLLHDVVAISIESSIVDANIAFVISGDKLLHFARCVYFSPYEHNENEFEIEKVNITGIDKIFEYANNRIDDNIRKLHNEIIK